MANIGTRTGTEKAQSGITHRSIRDGEVWGRKLHPQILNGAHINYAGAGQPFLFLATMAAVASGADATEHIAILPGVSTPLHYWPINAIAASMKGFLADAAGLRLDFDATAGDGVNIVPGGLLGPWRMVCKRTGAIPEGIFIRAKMLIEDVSGTTDWAVGVRKSEAVQAAIDNYDELACLNIQNGVVNRETILNNAATVTVTAVPTWADGEIHEVAVVCLGNGKIQFWFDGKQAVGTGAEYQFDADEVVVPFMFLLQATDLTTANLKELEVGFYNQFPYLPKSGKVR